MLLMDFLGPDIGGPHGPYKQVPMTEEIVRGCPDKLVVRKNISIPEPCRKATAVWACLPVFLLHGALERLCEGEEGPWFAQRLRWNMHQHPSW